MAPQTDASVMTPEPPIGAMGSLGDSVVSLPLDAPVPAAHCTSDAAATIDWSAMNHVWTGGSAASFVVKYRARRAIAFKSEASAEFLIGKSVVSFPSANTERRDKDSSGEITEEQRYRIDRAGIARVGRAKAVRVRLTGSNGRCEFALTQSAKARLAYFAKHAMGW